jgi:hypothetical protein
VDIVRIKKIVLAQLGSSYSSGWFLVPMVFLISHSVGYAQEDPGNFDVRSASATLNEGVYYLDSWIEYRLPSEAREALDSGVPLTIHIDVEFINPRWYWADENIGELRQSYQLQYHSVSQRYIVLNLNTQAQTNFSTLFSALNGLGRITELPLIDSALLDSDQNYDIRIRALLSTEDFPGPLRFLAFWRPDWSISSNWYRWPLED